MITKRAEAVLHQHQSRVLDRLDKVPGLVANHSLGSGKTITALSAAKKALDTDPTKAVLCIVPASLVDNIEKEIAKHGIQLDRSRFTVISYERAVNSVDVLKQRKYSLVIVDEAHRLRNASTKRAITLEEILREADKRLLLTGTISYNKLSDTARLINIAANEKILPETDKDFSNTFIGSREVQPSFTQRMKGIKAGEVSYIKNKRRLSEALKTYVDKYDNQQTPEAKKYFPTKIERKISVEMDPTQLDYYNFVMQDVSPGLAAKIREGLPLSKQEMSQFNMFANGVRQVSASISPYVGKPTESPKIRAAVQSMATAAKHTPSFRGVAYSNYLDAGLIPYKKSLEQQGIQPLMFTGALSAKEKKMLVDEYNNTEDTNPKVLLISSSGAEGLDLKGTRKLQVLEPHFNPAKIDQVIGRGVRYKSHEHLPEDARSVEVENYFSVYPKTLANKILKTKSDNAIDEYLYNMSQEKAALVGQMKELF